MNLNDYCDKLTTYRTAAEDLNGCEQLVKEQLFERVIEISKIIASGVQEPTTCSDKYSIPFSLAKENGMKLLLNKSYPASSIDIDWNPGYPKSVGIKITSVFRGEEDSSYTFIVFVDDKLYRENIEDLKEIYAHRAQSLKDFKEQQRLNRVKELKSELAALEK